MGDRERARAEADVFCPVRATMDLLGQKWTLHVVRELVNGKQRFNHALGGVNLRTLRKRLGALEGEGIVVRRVLSHIPPWVEYELTEKGRTLNAVVEAVGGWGRRWMKKPSPRGRELEAPSASGKGARVRPG